MYVFISVLIVALAANYLATAEDVWEDKKIFVADILRKTKKRKLEPDQLLEFNPEEQTKGLMLTKAQALKYKLIEEEKIF